MTLRALFLLCSVSTYANAEQALDPTRPAWSEPVVSATKSVAEKPVEVMTIAGILYGKDRQLVMLNNRYYRVGDRIGQQRIRRIEADRIWLSNANTATPNSNDIVMLLPRVTDIQKSKKATAHE